MFYGQFSNLENPHLSTVWFSFLFMYLSINSYFQDLVSKMSQEEKDKLIEQVIQAEPQLLLDILCEIPSSQSHQPALSKAPSWCKCNHCREMSRDIDKVCCGLKPENCLSEAAEFAILCLDRMVLAVAAKFNNNTFALNKPLNNNEARFASYRQFIFWRHGKLGKGKLKVLPSCCLWKVRDTFPDPNGQYAGFQLRGGILV